MNTHGPRGAFGPQPPLLGRPARGRNPLRRRTDRVQSWFTALFLLVLGLGLPMAAISSGNAAYASQMNVVHAQAAERHQVTARLAESPPGGPGQSEATELRMAKVSWTGGDGARHIGVATVPGDADAGTDVRVWVGRDGELAQPPTSASTARTMGWFTGTLTAAVVLAAAFAGRARVRQVLDRRRYAQWEAEWKAVEPMWSGRNRR